MSRTTTTQLASASAILPPVLALALALVGLGAPLSGCMQECVAYNDCPAGQYCGPQYTCIDDRGGPGPLVCEPGGTNAVFDQSRGLLVSGTHYLCPYPLESSDSLPRVVSHEGSTTLVSGGSTVLSLFWQGSTLDGTYLLFGGRNGNTLFSVPMSGNQNPILVELFVSQSATDSNPTFDVAFAAAPPNESDLENNELVPVGAHYGIPFNIIGVKNGDIQINISWDTRTDVDLHVQSPLDGEHVYFGNTTVSSGGELDLDSNAGCSGRDLRNENIYWPVGGAPSGEYKVWVDYWSACSEPGITRFRVTRILRQSAVEVYEEEFVIGDVENDPYSEANPLFTFFF